MRPEQNDTRRIYVDSAVLQRRARKARSQYIGGLLASACDATVVGIKKAGQLNVAVCVLVIVSGIALIAI